VVLTRSPVRWVVAVLPTTVATHTPLHPTHGYTLLVTRLFCLHVYLFRTAPPVGSYWLVDWLRFACPTHLRLRYGAHCVLRLPTRFTYCWTLLVICPDLLYLHCRCYTHTFCGCCWFLPGSYAVRCYRICHVIRRSVVHTFTWVYIPRIPADSVWMYFTVGSLPFSAFACYDLRTLRLHTHRFLHYRTTYHIGSLPLVALGSTTYRLPGSRYTALPG